MIEMEIKDEAHTAYQGWSIGLLELEGLFPRGSGPALDAEVERVEERLKARFGGLGRGDMARIDPARAYDAHFARAGRAYPVLLQAESIASKGRRIAMSDPLVRAMFAAELEGMLLTAGHDLDALRLPLVLCLATGSEAMPTLGGSEKTPPVGDLVLRDAGGIIASVLLGPDVRTSIEPSTSRLLFVIYAPPAIAADVILGQLGRLSSLAVLACQGATAGPPSILDL
jgi:hypothetical protein